MDGQYLIDTIKRLVDMGHLRLASPETMNELIGEDTSIKDANELAEHLIAAGKRIQEHVLESCEHTNTSPYAYNSEKCNDCQAQRDLYESLDTSEFLGGGMKWSKWYSPHGFRWYR